MYQILLDTDNIEIDKRELRRRLGVDDAAEFLGEKLALYSETVKHETSPKCTIRKTYVEHLDDGVDLGFGMIGSRNLMKNLEDCSSAYVMCVTLGTGADRLLRREAVSSVSDQFIIDAFLSAYVESICDHVQDTLPERDRFKARFAPGYGDFSITWQDRVLSFGGGREIGIDLTDSELMVPTKSITAIIGVRNE